MKFVLPLLALAAGAFIPIQAGINNRLKMDLGDSAMAAMVSFFVGTVALAVWVLARRLSFEGFARAAHSPLWIWTGGVLGAVFVSLTIYLAQKLGAAAMVAWLVAGQLVMGLFLDHFGLISYAVREATATRIAGAVLLVAGAVLLSRG